MLGDDLPEKHATPQEVAAAVERLTKAERLRLLKRAQLQIGGTEFTDPKELLGEAVKRAMLATGPSKKDGERGRPWPVERVSLPAFLSRSMDSIADASRNSISQVATEPLELLVGDEGDTATLLHKAGYSHPDVVELAIEREEALARQEAARADALMLERHFAGNETVLAVIEGEKDDMRAEEVRQLFQIDKTTYNSARRLLRRTADKLMPGRRPK